MAPGVIVLPLSHRGAFLSAILLALSQRCAKQSELQQEPYRSICEALRNLLLL